MGIAGIAAVGLGSAARFAPIAGAAAQYIVIAALVAAGLALLILAWHRCMSIRSHRCAAHYTSPRR
jgi:hypothetical protein